MRLYLLVIIISTIIVLYTKITNLFTPSTNSSSKSSTINFYSLVSSTNIKFSYNSLLIRAFTFIKDNFIVIIVINNFNNFR